MNHSRFIILRNIFDIYGPSIYKEKKKLEGLIRDLYPQEYVRERNALILTLKADVIERFYFKIPIEQSQSQLFHELSNEYCLDPELSNWVIQAWRYALSEEPLVENQNGIRVERKIRVNVREQCNCKEYGSFLTNYIWISDNHIGVILSVYGNHDYYFRKFDRFTDPEKFESARSLECAKDDSQKSDLNHLILNFDVNNNCLENAINIKSTKNIVISNKNLLSGGRSLRNLTVQNGALIEEWVIHIKNNCYVITPILWRDSAVTLLLTEPSPSISTVVSFSMCNGKIKDDFTVPFQHNSRNSNLCIGDIFYLDNRVYEPYTKYQIIAINLTTSKIIWKSELFSKSKLNKPFLIYSSAIIPDNDILFYCLGSSIISIDRMTGKTLWEYSLPEMADEYYLGSERRIVIHGNSLIIAGLEEISTINKISGELLWNYKVDDIRNDPSVFGYASEFTSNPIIYNNFVIIGRRDGEIDVMDRPPSVGWSNYIDIINLNSGTKSFNIEIDFQLDGNPAFLGNKLYCWSDDSLIEISLPF